MIKTVTVQITAFFEEHVGEVARVTVQRDCRHLVAAAQQLHTHKLTAERIVTRLLQACGHGAAADSSAGHKSKCASNRTLLRLEQQLQAALQQVANVKQEMDSSSESARPIVAAFVTFKCTRSWLLQ